jgi:hypothetical protein
VAVNRAIFGMLLSSFMNVLESGSLVTCPGNVRFQVTVDLILI